MHIRAQALPHQTNQSTGDGRSATSDAPSEKVDGCTYATPFPSATDSTHRGCQGRLDRSVQSNGLWAVAPYMTGPAKPALGQVVEVWSIVLMRQTKVCTATFLVCHPCCAYTWQGRLWHRHRCCAYKGPAYLRVDSYWPVPACPPRCFPTNNAGLGRLGASSRREAELRDEYRHLAVSPHGSSRVSLLPNQIPVLAFDVNSSRQRLSCEPPDRKGERKKKKEEKKEKERGGGGRSRKAIPSINFKSRSYTVRMWEYDYRTPFSYPATASPVGRD